ncbi:hypothetical protein NUSPORA_01421 [Nucleospora cyclopteri]
MQRIPNPRETYLHKIIQSEKKNWPHKWKTRLMKYLLSKTTKTKAKKLSKLGADASSLDSFLIERQKRRAAHIKAFFNEINYKSFYLM